MENLDQILALFGSTSPAIALLAWHIWNQNKRFDKFAESQDETASAMHDVDKRLAIIQNFIETRKGE